MKTNNRGYNRISNYFEGWKDIHETAGNGLAIYYKGENVKTLKELYLPTLIETLPASTEIWSEEILLFLVYH